MVFQFKAYSLLHRISTPICHSRAFPFEFNGTMTEFVSGVATMVLKKLATEAYQEIALAWDLKNDVQRLQDSMSLINAFLKDAENKQDRNSSITEWLQQLKHVFLDAGDALDEIECEALQNQVVNKYGSVSEKVHRFFSTSNKIAFSVKMTHKIKKIRERIDEIASSRTKFGLVDGHHAHDLFLSEKMPQWETHSYVVPSLVMGRDEEKEKVIDFLISPQSLDNGIDVIPIVGIGGLGKTTLAKLVYNDERVKGHFDLQAWVCISVDFDVKRIALEILKSLERTQRDDEKLTLQQVQIRLRNELHHKTFLIVMDDIWNDDRKKWQELTTLLLDNHVERNKNDSKIIITTRNHKIASITRTASTPQFNLKGLSDDDCLKLFLRQAFRAGEEEQFPRVVKIGKEIVKKCKGVPLAVVSLGCLLYSKVDESEWKRVRDSKIWELDEPDDGILPALRLSYNHLPPQLKQCVSYCSVFPKDYMYSNGELISFWLAHGLLKFSNENAEPEDLGHYYINELFSRFFFQDLENYDSEYYTFKMHDLVHDLAMSTMQSELAVMTSNFVNINEKVRHLVVSENSEGVPHFRHPLRKVRTFGLWSTSDRTIITKEFLTWICHQFKYLRVLDLHRLQLKLLPDCFDNMKHLRYLDLSFCSKIEELPESICKLQNLQMLTIWGCRRLQKIPKSMKFLVSLRILKVTTQESNLSTCGIWCLESLQVLCFYDCENLISLPCDLSHLTSLKKLLVWNCRRFVNFEEEQEDEKKENKEVKDLNLRQLSFFDLPELTALPRWLERSAKTMRRMILQGCRSLTALPEWLQNLTALENLHIYHCLKLSSLPNNMDRLCSLENLTIYLCPQLVANCQKNGPYWPKIAHVSNVILDGEKQ